MPPERIDLNLFRVFDTIMTHRSVAGASRELGTTASATSHALARLRKLLGDELFVLSEDGMLPTPRAIELAPSIREGLGAIGKVLDARPFLPGETIRTFGLAASDYAASIILPYVLQQLSVQAPGANLRVFPLGRLDIVQQLDDGRIDLLIGWFDKLPRRVRRQALMEEHEAIVVRPGHPLTQGVLTKSRLFGFPHIVIEYTGSHDQTNDGFIDDKGVMRRTWIERLLVEASGQEGRSVARIAATVPSYSVIVPTLEVTDMVATLPRRLARKAVEKNGLVMLDLPYAPLSVQVEMVWSQRTETDAGLRWFIEQVALAGRRAGAE